MGIRIDRISCIMDARGYLSFYLFYCEPNYLMLSMLLCPDRYTYTKTAFWYNYKNLGQSLRTCVVACFVFHLFGVLIYSKYLKWTRIIFHLFATPLMFLSFLNCVSMSIHSHTYTQTLSLIKIRATKSGGQWEWFEVPQITPI